MEARRNRRALQLLIATGVIMIALGLGWAVFFFIQGFVLVAVAELFLAALGIAVIATVRLNRVRMSAWMAFIGLFVFVCVFSAELDVQTANTPRSTHLFFLVLAVCAHHVFRAERLWLRYGCVCIFLLAFVVFAAIPEGAPPDYALSDGVRYVGIWINLAPVVVSLLVVLHLQESDTAAHRALHRALRDALSHRHFELFYQPQIDAEGHIAHIHTHLMAAQSRNQERFRR